VGSVTVEGVGLHTGARVAVRLTASPGPVRIAQGPAVATVPELRVISSARATTVEGPGGLRLGTVEHALSALAGLGIRSGLAVEVDGPEMPLLGGGAAEWCDLLRALALPREPPRLRVARPGVLEVGPSRYELAPGASGETRVAVRLDLDDPRLERDAAWAGDPDDFVARIAPARTFTLAAEVEELARRGLARHVDPASVVVVAPDTVHHAGAPFTPDEPARHKLLDLLGDAYLSGGPPLGRLRALRPGHASNVRAMARALAEGILAPA
jgi:UDP-3-O-[3-hydroxymyristoyl] N-acetylglucosamine deacetylase